MLKRYLVFLLLIAMSRSFAQEKYQTVKGRITEATSEQGIPGIRIQLLEENGKTLMETQSNADGYFELKQVPVGRRAFFFSSLLYSGVHVRDVMVNAGKEVILNVSMEERVVDAGGTAVNANDPDAAPELNKKVFQLEETSRYPASREDPARMVANYAGIQGTNDSRNDIIVRGNSPAGSYGAWKTLIFPIPITLLWPARRVVRKQSSTINTWPIQRSITGPSRPIMAMPSVAFSICECGMATTKNTNAPFSLGCLVPNWDWKDPLTRSAAVLT